MPNQAVSEVAEVNSATDYIHINRKIIGCVTDEIAEVRAGIVPVGCQLDAQGCFILRLAQD